MDKVRLRDGHDFEEWRGAARALLMRGTPPDAVRWQAGGDDLFAAGEASVAAVTGRAVGVVPPLFIDLAQVALHHDDPLRFALLYRLLFRLQKDHALLGARDDPDVARLYKLCADMRAAAARRREARNQPAPEMISPPPEEMSMDERIAITSLAAARAAVQGCTRWAPSTATQRSSAKGRDGRGDVRGQQPGSGGSGGKPSWARPGRCSIARSRRRDRGGAST